MFFQRNPHDVCNPNYAAQVLREPIVGLWYADQIQTLDITFCGMECRQEPNKPFRTFTKSGLRIVPYYPWELRMCGADGSELAVSEIRRQVFQDGLSAEFIKSIPTADTVTCFSEGERVRFSDSAGFITRVSPHLLDDETPAWQVFVEKCGCAHPIPERRLRKEHVFGEAFHMVRSENVELVSCDYFWATAKVQVRPRFSETGNVQVCQLSLISAIVPITYVYRQRRYI